MAKISSIFTLICVILLSTCFAEDNDPHCLLAHNNFRKVLQSYNNHFEKKQYSQLFVDVLKMSALSEKMKLFCYVSVATASDTTCSDAIHQVYNSSSQLLLKGAVFDESQIRVLDGQILSYQQFILNECTPNDFGSFEVQNDDGMDCIICGALVTLIENVVEVQQKDISDYLANEFCQLFPTIFSSTCKEVVDWLGPYIIDGFTKKDNSDVICGKAGACQGQFASCKLHPDEEQSTVYQEMSKLRSKTFYQQFRQLQQKQLSVSPWQWILDLIKKFSDDHLPLADLDGDRFSDMKTFRGTHWRGKDCDDLNKDIYPGRKMWNGNKGEDYNCNGVKGIDQQSGRAWKDVLCSDTPQIGVAVIGDSAGAHFELPPQWFNVSQWNKTVFSDLLERAEDELDLPYKSFSTGYTNEQFVSSLYKHMVQRNRCNRNDFQNCGVNGAASTDADQDFAALQRNQTTDNPLILVFELIGNDVCNSAHNFDSMTKPNEFKKNILKYWAWLDTVLPKGSHIMVLGLAQGTILYDSLDGHLHPINVTYQVFYDYMNCVQVSPCWGWMNTNETVRNTTQSIANSLNEVYKELVPLQNYTNFDIAYYDLPVQEVIDRAMQMGYTPADIIEPVDGFHPNQLANDLMGDILLEKLQKDHPDWLGPINPNNDLIDQMFPWSQ